jgi:hypothetical protein
LAENPDCATWFAAASLINGTISGIMRRLNHQFVRAMLVGLMLVVGLVQAQVSYFCGMMDAVMHDECCCADAGGEHMAVADIEPCCEKSVELFVDAVSDPAQTLLKSIEFESDVDPPHAWVSAVDVRPPALGITSLSGIKQTGIPDPVGSATYLTTQRLRI